MLLIKAPNCKIQVCEVKGVKKKPHPNICRR